MKENLETLATVIGNAFAWLFATIDAHWSIFQYAGSIVALAAAGYLAWTAFRIVRWVVRSALSTTRNVRHAIQRIGHRMTKNRIFRSMKGKFMAKYKMGELGSRIEDDIFDMQMNGRLSDAEATRVRTIIGKAIGDPFLIPRRCSKMFLRHYFLGSKDPKTGKVTAPVYQKLAGPKKESFRGAGGPPELHIPIAEDQGNVSSALLTKLKNKAA